MNYFKKAVFICLISLFWMQYVSAQTQDSEKEVFKKVEVIATFPGGMGEFYNFIAKNIRYPRDAMKKKIQGKVYIEFVIDEEGNMIQDSVKVFKGIYESLDNEAVKIIKQSPQWIPAKLTSNGPNVPIKMIVAIDFKL